MLLIELKLRVDVLKLIVFEMGKVFHLNSLREVMELTRVE